MAEIQKRFYGKETAAGQSIDSKWWIHAEKDAYLHAYACCRAIDDDLKFLHALNERHKRMYGNDSLKSGNYSFYKNPARNFKDDIRVKLNLAKACVDTATAKIAKNRPRPLFLTQKGNWEQRTRAKKLTQYVEGVFKKANIYKNGQLTFREGGIFGTGALKLVPKKGWIDSEKIPIDEVIVDETEAIYGKPRTMYHRRFVDRGVLLALYGDDAKKKEQILSCTDDSAIQKPDKSQYGDMVYVVEGWHLPSKEDGTDGKHIICIGNSTLVYEEYKKDYFPIFFIRWTEPVVGFYGKGIIEEITGVQLQINKTLADIQEGQHKMCAPQVWIESGTAVLKPITNELGQVNRYSGTPPTFYAPGAFSNEVYTHCWNLWNKGFEQIGISQLSATMKKPAGIESRAGLREYNDVETERFALTSQDYETFYMQIAEAIVDMSKDMFEKDENLAVNVPGRKFVTTIKWKDVSMEKDAYVMKVFPTAILPTTASGKVDRVQELIDMGLLDKRWAMFLLDFPDLEEVVSLETASLENILWQLDDIIENGKWHSPTALQDLELASKLAQEKYLEIEPFEPPPERLGMLRTYINQCMALRGISDSAITVPPNGGPPVSADMPPPAAPPAPPPQSPPPALTPPPSGVASLM